VKFVVCKVPLGQVLLRCCCFPLSLSLHHRYVLVFVLPEGQAGGLGNLQKSSAFSEIWNHWIGNYNFHVVTVRTAQLYIQQFYVLLTQCIYVFCVDLRTNSDYFTIQH